MTVYNLALNLEDQHRLSEALPLMQRVETGWTKVLGVGHPETKAAKRECERIQQKLEASELAKPQE